MLARVVTGQYCSVHQLLFVSSRQEWLSCSPAHLVHAEDTHPELRLRVPPGISEVAWACRLERGGERRRERRRQRHRRRGVTHD